MDTMTDILMFMIMFCVLALGAYIVYEHNKQLREKDLEDTFGDLDITLNDGLEHETTSKPKAKKTTPKKTNTRSNSKTTSKKTSKKAPAKKTTKKSTTKSRKDLD
jgi:topoisomerase IA-like protein